MSENPQFLRTDKAIMQAFISLLSRKSFEKITVQDILDETPVSRATFYAHYRDKYEIAEKMLEYFLAKRDSAKKILASPAAYTRADIRKILQMSREFVEALLKVHTENVDFRQAIADELEKEYLAASDSPLKEVEARVFAQARTEVYLYVLRHEPHTLSLDDLAQALISVSLQLMNLPDDPETRAFLADKITQQNTFI